MLSGKTVQRIDDLVHRVKQMTFDLFQLGKARLSSPIMGVDINSDFIKLLKVSQVTPHLKVDYFAVLPLPKGAIVKNEIKECEVIANVLKEAVEASKMPAHVVALAVNRSAAIIKSITIDHRLSSDEIESRVWIEANRLFPNLVSDIYLDFAIVGPSAQDVSQIEVMLVACRKDYMKPYFEIMRLADLTPKIVDVNSYAFERALAIIVAQHSELKTVALLNIDFSLISLIVLQDNKLIYTHELGYDGQSLLQQEASLETPPKEALHNDILMASISLHLRHTMQFFYSSKPHTKIEKMILSGDCVVYFPDLPQFIQGEVGIEVSLPDLFKDMLIGSHVDKEKLMYHAPQLILSCGLALSKEH